MCSHWLLLLDAARRSPLPLSYDRTRPPHHAEQHDGRRARTNVAGQERERWAPMFLSDFLA